MRKSTPSKVETIVINIGLLFTILAIALLKCRSAYLVVLIFLAFEYITPNIINKIKSIKIGFRILILAFILLAIVFTLSFLIASKQASTNGRLMIAENCLRLIKSKPITGYGFGTFEKTYNDYSVSLKITQNEFVNYAYNDFLELGVEGGIPAFFLWSLFIFFVIIFSYRGVRSEYNILPAVIAFLILQLTNFAFYALPVFSVFLVYVGLITPSPEVINSKVLTQYFRISVSKKVKNIFAVIGICISATFFFSALFIGVALHKNATINNTSSILEKRFEFENIGHYLNGYPQYHEYYGDYWMKENRNDSALLQFCIALKNTDAPKLLLKTGYCFQQMNLYDSSEFYFKKAIMIQPYKFFPRLFLLKMYVAKQDSAKVIKEAEQIVLMPIKVKSKEVDIIKEYAQKILKQY